MQTNPKLHQVLAIEKGVKSRVYAVLSEIYKAFQKPALFNGLKREYQKKDEDGENFPPESTRVQNNVSDLLKTIQKNTVEYWDIVATKDFANQSACADLVVDGQVLIKDAPATLLLFLEKQLTDLKSEIDKMPELDPGQEWTQDVNSLLYRSEPRLTTKTAKVQKPIVLFPATDKHPAQTQLIIEDRAVGNWTEIRYSGAIPTPRKVELQERVQVLLKAVKFARQAANEIESPHKEIGGAIFAYLLK